MKATDSLPRNKQKHQCLAYRNTWWFPIFRSLPMERKLRTPDTQDKEKFLLLLLFWGEGLSGRPGIGEGAGPKCPGKNEH